VTYIVRHSTLARRSNREDQIMTKTEQQAECLDRARNGQTMTNYPAIFAGFLEKGIQEADIRPRENVFTFNAWKALGRSVKKGEHGVKVVTFIERTATERDATTGEQVERSFRSPHVTTVFHISQTETEAERQARKPPREPKPAFGERRRKSYTTYWHPSFSNGGACFGRSAG
jgi:antirestriction protein ArdC